LRPGQLQAPAGLIDPRLEKRDFIMPLAPTGGGHCLFEQGVSRIYHHLCDVRLGISLAGGGARGLVHFGVLRALDRAGIFFDMMSGTSAGAMFGLSYATGLQIDYMLEEYRKSLTPGFPFNLLPNGDRWFLVWKYRTRSWDRLLRCHFDGY
jgi:predicted acylesterase/phospholipase RssA